MPEAVLAAPTAGVLQGPGDLVDLLERIERRVPVNAWRAGTVDLWPLVRVRLAHRLARALDARPPRRVDAGPVAVVERAGQAAHGLARLVAGHRPAPRQQPEVTDPTRRAVICSDGVSYVDTSVGPRDRHADPLRALLASRGVGTTLLAPGYRVPAGLAGDVRRVQPRLDLAVAGAQLRPRPAVELPGYADAVDELRSAGVDQHLASAATIARAAAAVSAMSSTFDRELRRSGADLGLVVEYYALHGMAFVLACHQAGVPAIDIQHGLQGPTHYAYSAWTRLPEGGSALLPDRFWVWDDLAAATIAAWAPEGPRRAIVGGNLELREWARAEAPGAADAEAEVADLVHRHRATDVVLVALSGEESDAAIDALLDAVAAGPGDWLWAVRCHPSQPTWRRWADRAAARGLSNVEAERTTRLPLYALLRAASVVVTRHSTVVLDALAFGVRSVLLDSLGAQVFALQVERGDATVAGPTADDIVTAVTLTPRPTAPDLALPDADKALDDLLGGIR